MFKKKEHQTLFMLGLLLVAPVLYYRYRKDIIDFQRKFMWAPSSTESKAKKPQKSGTQEEKPDVATQHK